MNTRPYAAARATLSLGDKLLEINWGFVLLVTVIAAIGFAMLFSIDALSRNTVAPLWLICVTLFVLAWIGQFIGHAIEKKRPSFFRDLQFLMIGPMWLLTNVYRRLGIRFASRL